MPAGVAVLKILRLAALLAVAGCMSPTSAAVSPLDPPQLAPETRAFRQQLIKFKPGTIVCDAAGIAQLSATTHVPLEFVRPMSGDACVIRQSADSAAALTQGERTLRQHPAVEWLEEDRRMKAL